MFAVKGWSVDSTALKTQTQAVPNLKKSEAPDATAGAESQKSNKRKRAKEAKAQPSAVNDSNVGDLWARTFEGKKDEKKPKKVKVDSDAAADKKNVAAASEDKAEVDSQSKPGEAEKKGKNKKNKKQKDNNGPKPDAKATDESKAIATTVPPPPTLPTNSKLTPMQSAMRQKLISARFRHLNETLYTAPSATSLALFADNPEMFDDYHSGFRQQVTTWPENPVDTFIRSLRERGQVRPVNQNRAFRDKKRGKEPKELERSSGLPPLPRTKGTCHVADLGCGDARLASTFQTDGSGQKNQLKIMSYDLQSNNKIVTKADIANLPLEDGSMDVAIFCLALMGTNWIDFIEEAYRVLHWKGELWIAEIKSRFGRVGGDRKSKVVEHSVGNRRKAAAKQKVADTDKKKKDAEEDEETLATEVDGVVTKSEETDVTGFVEVLKRRGFVLKDEKSVDLSNRMFVKMEFIKAAPALVGKNVREQDEKKGEDGTWKPKQKKFVDQVKEVSVEDETKALKPCLYKIR